jgi:adenylate cyclase
VSDQTVRNPRLTRQQLFEHVSRTQGELETALAGASYAQRAQIQSALSTLAELVDSLQAQDRSLRESESERHNLMALTEIGRVVNSSLDVDAVLAEVIDTIIRLTGCERAFLMLRSETGEMDTVVARNWERASLEADDYEISRSVVAQTVRQSAPVLTTNARIDPRFDSQTSVVTHGLRSILCVPLKVKGQLTGVLYADHRIREGLFTERHLKLLTAFADQAAVAVENARLFASVRNTLAEVTVLKSLMEDVFASIDSAVITADTAGTITLCNAAAEVILGVPQSALLGRQLRDLLEEIAPDLPRRYDDVVSQEKRITGLECTGAVTGRGRVSLEVSLAPLKREEHGAEGVVVVLDDLTQARRLESQYRLFERMVSPAVIRQLDPDSLHLGGRRADITTLFADLRGFTSFSETNNPEVLVRVLNLYLAAAAEAVLAEEGTIDKYLGDGLMAWFNAPIPQPDHTLRAMRASLAICEAVRRVQAKMPRQFHLSFGIGIHYGDAILGLVGTQNRLDYTAIGDSVNTAKRLQENAAAGQILVSQAAAQRVRGLADLREVAALQVKGKEQPVDVFELVSLLPS